MKRFTLLFIVLTLTLTALSVSAQDTYTTTGRARVRTEPNTTSSTITTLRRGASVTVTDTVDGSAVSGSTLWYQVSVNNQIGYIHSSLLSAGGNGSSGSGSGENSSTNQSEVPISTPPPQQPAGFVPVCSGNVYNCGDLTRDQINAYAAACSGDPSRLDRDKDGLYCE